MTKSNLIYIFGNALLPEDSLPLQLLPDLRKSFPNIEFIHSDPNEDFPPEGEKNPVIIDAVAGINEPMIIDVSDLKSIEKTPVSPHDYDLLFHLLLLKKLNKINNAVIYGLPQRYKKDNNKYILDWLSANLQSFNST